MAGLNDAFFQRPVTPMNDGFFSGAQAPIDPEWAMQTGAGELERGVRRGLSGIINTGQAAVGQLAEPFAPEFGRSMIQSAIEGMGRTHQRFAPAVESYKDIHDVGSLGNYVASKAGEMAPIIPLALGGSALGRAATRTAAGGQLGGMASFLPQTVGSEAMALRQDPAAQSMSPAGRAVHALSLGAAEAAVGALVPAAATERLLTPRALPRGLGANVARFAGNTAVGTAAGGAGMAAMDLTSQLGRQTYDPNAQVDLEALKEAFVGGMAGTLPFAGAHAAASHAVDTGVSAGDLAVRGAKGVGAGAKFIGETAYGALPEGLRTAADRAAEIPGATKEAVEKAIEAGKGHVEALQTIAEESPSYAVAAGRATAYAGEQLSEFGQSVKAKAQELMPHIEQAVDSVVHHSRSDQARLERTVEALTEPPTDTRTMTPLLERENFFRAMADHFDPEGREAALMREAADAIAEINTGEMPPEQILPRWREAVIPAALKLRESLSGEKVIKARQELVEWLKTDHPDAKYSRLIPAKTRADIRDASRTTTGDNMIDTTLDKAFSRIGWSRIDFGGERGEVSELIKRVARKMMEDGPSHKANRALRTYLHDTFGSRIGGEIEGAVHSAVETGKQGSEADAVKGERDVLSYVRENLQDKKPGRAAKVMELIRDEMEIINNYSGRELRLQDLPEAIRKSVEGRLRVRAEMGDPSTVSRLASEEVVRATNAELAELISGDVQSVKMRVREMYEKRYGGIKDAMEPGSQFDPERLNASYVEHVDNEGKYNEGTLHEVPAPREREVHSTDEKTGGYALPLTGHTTVGTMHTIGGRIGEAQIALLNEGSPHSTQGTSNKPARAGASGYVDVDRVNVLHHVGKMDRKHEQTDDDVLAALHQRVVDDAVEQIAKLQKELRGANLEPERLLGYLREEYSVSRTQREAARTDKQPWEVFDARRKLVEKYRLDPETAQRVTDLFWAEVKRDWLQSGDERTPREFFEKFPHYFPSSRVMASGHESLDYYEIAKATLTDRKAGGRGIKGATPEEGVLLTRDENGDRHYIDMPQLMETALGKVRGRTEGIDDLGQKERYDDGLYLENGKLNERYVQDMRSALASVALSLKESSEYKLDGDLVETLTNPDLLLRRGDDVRVGDIMQTRKVLNITEQVAKDVFLKPSTVAHLTGLQKKQRGLLGAGDQKIFRVVDQQKTPVVLDLQALVRHVLLQNHVSPNDAPRSVFYAALNEGIRALRASGEFLTVGQGSLERPTHEHEGARVVDGMYQDLVIGDKAYRKEDGTYVSKNSETAVALKSEPEITRASKLDFDPQRRALAALDGFMEVLDRKIRDRENPIKTLTSTDVLNTPEVAALHREIAKGNAKVGELRANMKLAEAQREVDRVLGLHVELKNLTDKLVAEALAKKPAPPTKGEIERLSRLEEEEYARTGKKPYREDLDELSLGELKAKLENVADRRDDLAGQSDKPFVTDDGRTGETERTRGAVQEIEIKNTGEGSHEIRAKTKAVNPAIPVTKEQRAMESRGNMVPGTVSGEGAREIIKAGPAEMPTIPSVIPGEAKRAAEAKAAPLPPKRVTADPTLQRFIDALTKNAKGDLREMNEDSVRAYYDAAEAIDTPQAKRAVSMIKNYADRLGIDLTKGPKYAGAETVPVPEAKPVFEGRERIEQGAPKQYRNATFAFSMGERGLSAELLSNGHVGEIRFHNRTWKTSEFIETFGQDRLRALQNALIARAEGREPAATDAKLIRRSELEGVQKRKIENPIPDFEESAAMKQQAEVKDYTERGVLGERDRNAEPAEKPVKPVRTEAPRKDTAPSYPTKSFATIQAEAAVRSAYPTEPRSNIPEQVKVPQKRTDTQPQSRSELPRPTTKYSRIVLPDGRSFEGEDANTVRDVINHLFNADVTRVVDRLQDKNGNEVGGSRVPDKNSPLGFFINLSIKSRSMLGSNGMHEALHGLFTVLGQTEHGRGTMEKLTQTLTSGIVQERLQRVLAQLPLEPKDREAILKDIKSSPEEAAAYAFQFWATGDLKLGSAGDGIFARVGRFFRNLFGITKDYERTENFLNSFLSGEMGRADFKPSALEKAFAERNGDKVLQVLKKHMEPFQQVMHTVFDSSIKAMERLNSEDANTLVRKYTGYGDKGGFIKRVRYESNILSSAFQHVVSGHKPEALEKAMVEIHAGKPQSEAAKAIMGAINQVNAYAGRPKDFIPEILDHEKIRQDREGFDAAIKDFGEKTEAKGPTRTVLDVLTDMGWNEGKEGTAHFLPQYASERAKWMQHDPLKFMRSLIVNSVRQTERNRIFESQEVESLLARIQQSHGNDAYHKALDFVDGMEGRMGRNMSPAVRSMMIAAMVAGNIMTLPLAVFAAMADPFHLAARSNNLFDAGTAYFHGLGSVFRTIHEGFGGKHKNSAEEAFAEETGAIEHAMLTDLLGDVYLNDSAEGLAKKVNDWFFKANFLDGWTRQTRVAAVTVAQRFIKEHAQLKGKHSQHFMDELGLKPSDVKDRGDGNLELNDKVKMAINKFVDQAIVRPDQATNAIWMNDPRFMLLTHMKRFTYAFNDVVLNRVMHEAGRGNLAPLAILSASVPAIIMADMGKHLLKGDYDTWSNAKATRGWFDYGMMRSGMNGKLQFGLDAVHDAQMGGTPFDSALGPDLGMVKKVLGPGHHAGTPTGGGSLLGLADDALILTQAYLKIQEAANEGRASKK